MEIEITSRPNIDPTTMAKLRGLVTRQVSSCTACGLVCGMPHGPVPYTGPSDGLFTAIGEGPGPDESRLGAPFVGRSGKLLRAMLSQVHIGWDQVLRANVVSCWPKTTDGKGTRAPSDAEARACRENLLSQVGIGNAPFVLLVGGTALRAVRPDLKVSKIHGMIFLWTMVDPLTGSNLWSNWVMPILHPAAILRQRVLKEPTIQDLKLWADIVKGEMDPAMCLSDGCVVCNDFLSHYDPDGVGYCEKHWGRHGNDWKLAREFWLPRVEKDSGQGTLV